MSVDLFESFRDPVLVPLEQPGVLQEFPGLFRSAEKRLRHFLKKDVQVGARIGCAAVVFQSKVQLCFFDEDLS